MADPYAETLGTVAAGRAARVARLPSCRPHPVLLYEAAVARPPHRALDAAIIAPSSRAVPIHR
jgi:hypothetical protein